MADSSPNSGIPPRPIEYQVNQLYREPLEGTYDYNTVLATNLFNYYYLKC